MLEQAAGRTDLDKINNIVAGKQTAFRREPWKWIKKEWIDIPDMRLDSSTNIVRGTSAPARDVLTFDDSAKKGSQTDFVSGTSWGGYYNFSNGGGGKIQLPILCRRHPSPFERGIVANVQPVHMRYFGPGRVNVKYSDGAKGIFDVSGNTMVGTISLPSGLTRKTDTLTKNRSMNFGGPD